LERCPAPWWLAGGHAIELVVGRPLRAHGDIDVLLLRRDQLAVQEALPGWEWWAAEPPGSLRRWRAGEALPAAVHDIWCRDRPDGPWRLQVMLDESDGDEWVSRRDARVRLPLRRLGRAVDGIPCLAPQVQLFYKAGAPRARDEIDLVAGLPVLSTPERRWLADAIATAYGPDHPWRQRVIAPAPPPP
jgi:hypothetical protein